MPRPEYRPAVSTGWRYYLFRLLFRYRERDERLFDFMLLAPVASVFGSLVYPVEGPEHGYASISSSIHWAIMTMAIVGCSDITPQMPLGLFVTALILIGYAIIAVPTGICTAERVHDSMLREPYRCAHRGYQRVTREARCCAHCGQPVSARD